MPSLVRAGRDSRRAAVPPAARDESDRELLAGFAASEPAATAAFVERFQRRVFGVAARILGDARLAEDVAQEAFVRAWQKAGTFDDRRGSVASWLLTIARNLAIDAVRRRRVVIEDTEKLLARDDPDPGRGPAELGLLALESERLRVAIGRLPPVQRRALVLSAYFGRTAREIAETEAIPLGTAKTRIRAAMIRLRDELSDGELVD